MTPSFNSVLHQVIGVLEQESRTDLATQLRTEMDMFSEDYVRMKKERDDLMVTFCEITELKGVLEDCRLTWEYQKAEIERLTKNLEQNIIN